MRTGHKAIEELGFELRDIEIFKIPDVRTRLTTIQNYFFPRLDLLMNDTFALIQEVYGIDPTQRRIGFVHRPKHRKNAPTNRDYGEVYIGIAGRMNSTPLPIKDEKGKPYFYPPPHLMFSIDVTGSLKVEFRPFVYFADNACKTAFSNALLENLPQIAPHLAIHHIAHGSAWDLIDLPAALSVAAFDEFGLCLASPTYLFPLTLSRGLRNLQKAFVTLYPLFDALLCLARGENHELPAMIRLLNKWHSKHEEDAGSSEGAQKSDEINLPELESYRFVRAGLWWEILARDNWRCCSCGRTAKEDGIVLHVDHILPRSKGGEDKADNLQVMCHKCNIGKSNRDSTDLRNLE